MKKKILFHICIAFFAIIIFGINAEAQVTEYYFRDTEQKEGSTMSVHLQYDNTMIIGAVTMETYRKLPVVMRIDTLGNVLWNTGLTDTTVYSYDRCRVDKLTFSGGFLFASVYLENYYSNSQMEFWKIDPTSGNIIWKKKYEVKFNPGNKMLALLDYDSTNFLTGYKTNSASDNYLVFVNKLSGDTLNNNKIESSGAEFIDISIDSHKDIYYLLNDTLYKRSGINPQNLIWKSTYSGTKFLKHVYVDANDSVFIFGNSSVPSDFYSRVLSINTCNGSSLWMTQHYSETSLYRDMKDKNGFLFITWQHRYVGSGDYYFRTNKINKLTGHEEWFTNYGFSIPGVGNNVPQSGISLDIDQSGDVYLTGYCNSYNYEPATFAILKLNGFDGGPVYQKIIDLDTNIHDDLSVGLASCIINNKPYFAGTLQTDFAMSRQKIVFIKLNPSTGDTVFMKFAGGNYQFPSNTIYIGNYINNQTLVLKQYGRKVKVESYDFAKHLIWERTISSEYYLSAGNIASTPSGDIYLSALSSAYYSQPPFYASSKDSLFIYQLNSSGDLVYKYSEYVNSTNIKLLEMYADSGGAFVVYSRGGIMYIRKLLNQIVSAEQSYSLSYVTTIAPTKNVVNVSPSEAWILSSNPYTKCSKFNKNTMTVSAFAQITIRLYTINWAEYFDASHALVCGKNSTNRACLGMYNTSAYDTTWTRQLSINSGSEALKFITNPSRNYIYVMCHNASNIEIQKLAASNGAQKWVYTYNGSANLDDVPQNITYDSIRNQLLITGYEKNGLYKQVLILTLDTNGIAIDTIKRIGDFKGDNVALCSHVLYNGTQWVGGNLNKNPYGKAGFIYETAVLPCLATTSSQTVSACSPFLWMGHIYSTSGTYSDTIPNNAGCDSVLFLNLNFFQIIASATQNDSLLTANAGAYNYQWVNCDSAFAPIIGATNQTFIVQSNGNYAVVVNQGTCYDTSSCMNVNYIGINELSDNGYTIFPNPSNNFIVINTPNELENGRITVYNVEGKEILQQVLINTKTYIDISSFAKGLYFIKLSTKEGALMRKFVKE